MSVSVVLAIASKEWMSALRNRWVLGVSVILVMMALAISYFAFAPRGQTGFGGFEVTVVSLSSLVVYLVPIVALTLGFDAVVGEAEGKTLELVLTMPVTRLEFFLGKFIGLGASLAASIVAGFGLAGVVIALRAGTAQLGDYAFFIASAVLLGLVFLSLALMASAAAGERSKAVAWVLFFWFFFVLVYDLVLIGVLVATEGRMGGGAFSALLYLNPADLFRLMNLAGVEGMRATYGLTTLAQGPLFDVRVLAAGMLLWIAVPLAAGYMIFRKKRY